MNYYDIRQQVVSDLLGALDDKKFAAIAELEALLMQADEALKGYRFNRLDLYGLTERLKLGRMAELAGVVDSTDEVQAEMCRL